MATCIDAQQCLSSALPTVPSLPFRRGEGKGEGSVPPSRFTVPMRVPCWRSNLPMTPAPPNQAPPLVAAEQLKIVILGHVDHGKSTLVGRLFHDTGSLPEGRLEQLQRAAQRRGVPFEWANLMDALQAERDQNISIDTAQIWFQTPKRRYVIIDAPGHQEFIKNMVTGAAQAEAALVVIDAQEGVQENSRRHGYLLELLGIRQVAVLVNKMDLVGYARERFDAIEAEYRAWLKQIGLEPSIVIPIAARQGDNIAARSQNMPWWNGPTVLATLDEFKAARMPGDQPLRFPIQDVYRFDHRRILAGRVESGRIKVGDRLVFSPSNKTSTVKSIERWNASGARLRRGRREHRDHLDRPGVRRARGRRRAGEHAALRAALLQGPCLLARQAAIHARPEIPAQAGDAGGRMPDREAGTRDRLRHAPNRGAPGDRALCGSPRSRRTDVANEEAGCLRRHQRGRGDRPLRHSGRVRRRRRGRDRRRTAIRGARPTRCTRATTSSGPRAG